MNWAILNNENLNIELMFSDVHEQNSPAVQPAAQNNIIILILGNIFILITEPKMVKYVISDYLCLSLLACKISPSANGSIKYACHRLTEPIEV